jgi:hypothetical protein
VPEVSAGLLLCPAAAFAQPFLVEESTIERTQRAIQRGETTCREVIAGYVERARAYNGVCTALVTRDGAAIAPAHGPVRAGAPLKYPTQTVAVDTLLPSFADYAGKPVELTAREYALLEYLAHREGQVVTRTDIWEQLYGHDDPTTSNVVDVYIGYLRNKIDRDHPVKLIHTRRGLGYVLTATS